MRGPYDCTSLLPGDNFQAAVGNKNPNNLSELRRQSSEAGKMEGGGFAGQSTEERGVAEICRSVPQLLVRILPK